jgi:hypothetical protein
MGAILEYLQNYSNMHEKSLSGSCEPSAEYASDFVLQQRQQQPICWIRRAAVRISSNMFSLRNLLCHDAALLFH